MCPHQLSDTDVFEESFHRLQPRLFAFCCKYIERQDVARDIVQECFMGLWDKRHSIDPPYDAYLFRSVYNRCMSYFKAKRVRTDYELSCRERIGEHGLHHQTPYPLTELYVKDIQELMRLCVEKLPEKRREIFVMSRYQNLTYAEIAETLGLSVRTVEAQIHAAIKSLREELKDYLPLIIALFPGLLN